MAKLDRRDRVTIAAGAFLLLGILVLAVSALLMNPLTAVCGVLVAGCGGAILTGQSRLARRPTR